MADGKWHNAGARNMSPLTAPSLIRGAKSAVKRRPRFPTRAMADLELHITARRPSPLAALRELVAYRDLLWILAYREISIRYKQTALGIIWVVLQPVLTTIIFTLLARFAKLPSEGVPRVVFAFCGVTLWSLFAQSIDRAGGSIIADERLITKVYFPRAAIPLASLVSSAFDFVFALAVLLVVAAVYGFTPGLSTFALIPAVLIAVLAAAGIGAAFAGWTVRYRDFRYLCPFFLQLGLYVSPTFYSISLIPPAWREWYFLNPMAGAIELFRYGITGRTQLDLHGVLISALVALVLFFAGGEIFRRVEQSFADHI
jgi:lipopolysaccharide transport system permease protein